MPKRKIIPVLPPYCQVPCCIACGRCLLMTLDPEMIAEEREDWKQQGVDDPNNYAIVGAEEVDNMYFHQHPWVWTVFHRAILVRPNRPPRLSGITQNPMTSRYDGAPVPYNTQKALIGNGRVRASRRFARYETVNAGMLQPHLLGQTYQQLGYIVHAHCWVLLRDHVFGRELMDRMHLSTLVEAIHRFWGKTSHLWNQSDYDTDGIVPHTPGTTPGPEYYYGEPPEHNSEDKNPAYAPEIQVLISQAARSRHHSPAREDESSHHQDEEKRLRPRCIRGMQTGPQLPPEIVMLIVDVIHNDPDYSQTSVEDTNNLLNAMQWKLPDSYWQTRCQKDLIFEFQDLAVKCRNQKMDDGDKIDVDWQFLCLESEKLLLDFRRYNLNGLRNRKRVLALIKGIKDMFLEVSREQGSAQL